MLKKNKLEELLLTNWTKFIDMKLFSKIITENVHANINQLAFLNKQKQITGTKITISKFQLLSEGFVIWVEFQIPYQNNMTEGTIEFLLLYSGHLKHIQTIGNVY